MAVYVRGVRQLQNRVVKMEESPRGIMREIALQTVLRAKDSVQVKTGRTRRSIRVRTTTRTLAVVRAGGAARYLERGTRPHDIRPRNKKVLFFPSQRITTARFGGRARLHFTRKGLSARSMRAYGNAAFVMTKLVHHPGQKATPFLVPSAEDAVANVLPNAIINAWNSGA